MLPFVGFFRHIKPLLPKGGRICHSKKLSGAVAALECEQRSTPRGITEPRIEWCRRRRVSTRGRSRGWVQRATWRDDTVIETLVESFETRESGARVLLRSDTASMTIPRGCLQSIHAVKSAFLWWLSRRERNDRTRLRSISGRWRSLWLWISSHPPITRLGVSRGRKSPARTRSRTESSRTAGTRKASGATKSWRTSGCSSPSSGSVALSRLPKDFGDSGRLLPLFGLASFTDFGWTNPRDNVN